MKDCGSIRNIYKKNVITVKYDWGHRNHLFELVDEPKSNPTEFLCISN